MKILQHLRSRLKGAALRAVSGALLSGALLDDVMSIITKRFGNPRLVVKNVCDKLLSRARVKVSDVNDLTSFSIDIDNTASVIKAMGYPSELDNLQSVFSLCSKLPTQTDINKW